MDSSEPSVCVCIPTYNEAGTIGEVISRIEGLEGLRKKIVVVDDNSGDGTSEIVRRLMGEYGNIRLIEREGKLGLGSALIEGFEEALKMKPAPNFVVSMDGDLSHDPYEIPGLVRSCDNCAMIIGSRYVKGGEIQGWTMWRRAVSGGANLLARYLGGLPVRDCTSGFRCYSSDLVKNLIGSVTREGFDFQIDALMNAVRKGYQVREHPISFRDREAGESKLGLGEYLNFLILVFSRLRF
ncbi:Polyprenol monophosphomannose synthase [subsurface metagenome]